MKTMTSRRGVPRKIPRGGIPTGTPSILHLKIGAFQRRDTRLTYKILSAFIAFTFSFTSVVSPAYAQSIASLNLPSPGTMVAPSAAFVPVLLKGMTIHPDNPLQFDFIIDSGNTNFKEDQIKAESQRLVKYFLASMTIPKDDLWVNLSPYEKDRIIPDELGKTELGRDMLAQDYILKQLTASLMYPEKELGKAFWDRVYKLAKEKYGTTEIPVNTFNKVWILPETATVYEHGQTVYIVEAKLRVMLDSDYLAMSHNVTMSQSHKDVTGDVVTATEGSPQQGSDLVTPQVVREIILPEIEREVNEGQNFAPLRQIYHSLILAKWYKETIKNSLLSKVYVDKKLMKGIRLEDGQLKGEDGSIIDSQSSIVDQIYNQYMDAYKRGVFNYIKEDYDQLSNDPIPRKYFSGGITGDVKIVRANQGMASGIVDKPRQVLHMELAALRKGKSSSPVIEESNDAASLKAVISTEIIQARFASRKSDRKHVLIGFMRDANDKIQPIFSGSEKFQSTREITPAIPFFGTGWNPEREARQIPLEILSRNRGVQVTKMNKTDDWTLLPNEIKDLFERGNILVTSSSKGGSNYSILMAVTPQNGQDKSEGRSGILLKDGLPIIININGKEFILEIKGAGNAEGGFDTDQRFLRGGVQVVESSRELESLEMKRRVGKSFILGDIVRAVAEINFRINGRQQGYLLRLAPGSVRATYNANESFKLGENKANRVRKIAHDMGKQMGEYFSEGFVAISHPENLIVIDEGRGFVYTDYSDILPIHIFPTELEGQYYDLYGVIKSSLYSVTEIPDYEERNGLQPFMEGLADGLLETGKISTSERSYLVNLTDFNQVRDFLWKKFLAADYYKLVRGNGRTPSFFEHLRDSVDQEFLNTLVKKAREKQADNNGEIARRRKKLDDEREQNRTTLTEIAELESLPGQEISDFIKNLRTRGIFYAMSDYKAFQSYLAEQRKRVEDVRKWETDRLAEIEKYEKQNRLLERTGFTIEGIIEMTNSEEAGRSFAKAVQAMDGMDFWHSEYYVIWDLWHDNLFNLGMVIGHLTREEKFLETVLNSIGPDLSDEVNRNLALAKERLAELRQLTPYEFYQRLLANPELSKQMALLPYISEPSGIIDKTGDKTKMGTAPDSPTQSSSPVRQIDSNLARSRQDQRSWRMTDGQDDVGGIDMNSIDLDRQGAGVDIQFDPAELQDIIDAGIDGFAPVIINITPLPSVLPLLGLDPATKEEGLEVSRLN